MRSTDRRSGLLARHDSGGFTLVELAVVIAIVALLLGAILTPLATQHQARKSKETERSLRDIKEALIGFAMSNNGRLPCPDTDGDGLENTAAPVPPEPANCTNVEGILPWQTLGVMPADSWGRFYRYRVTQEFAFPVRTGEPATASPPERLALNDTGILTVNTRGDDPTTAPPPSETKAVIAMTTNAPAVVVSHGANGFGGTQLAGGTVDIPTVGTDEDENFDGNTVFVLRTRTPFQAGCVDDLDETVPLCEFDDLLIWISTPELLNRLVQANLLP
jgi:prepilin-type N-terminal cleavage/methylation domain-containing protein